MAIDTPADTPERPTPSVVLQKPTTITDTIVEELRGAILGGGFAPGEHLHQTQLAEKYGVSRIPLRDALSRLEGDGLIEIDSHRQARVVRLEPDDVREIYDIRIALEPVAAHSAVESMTPRDAIDLGYRMDIMDSDADDPVAGQRSRRAFYDGFYRLSGQPRMHAIIMRLRDEITIFHLSHPSSHDSHGPLRDAITERDAPAAEAFMRDHLQRARDHLAELLASRGDD